MRAVRFSAGWETTEADWEALVKGVAKVHGEMHHGKHRPCFQNVFEARPSSGVATSVRRRN